MKEYKVKVFENKTEWYFKGKLHREGGPAIEWCNRDKFWFKNGEYHREDGPAIEFANGSKCWYLEGNLLTEKDFNKFMQAKAASTCDGKYVEVDGVKYKLVKI